MSNHNLPTIFQTILHDHAPLLVEAPRCPICEEETDDCVCQVCEHCGVSDIPIFSLEGRVCPNCGELMGEVTEDSGDEEYYLTTETRALISRGY